MARCKLLQICQKHPKNVFLLLPTKSEVPHRAEASKLEAEDIKAQQVENKLNTLETSLVELGKTYPNLQLEDFYEKVSRSAYEGSLSMNRIEDLVDALDNYTLSEQGVQRFNSLVKEGKIVYLSNLLIFNYQALQQPEVADIPDREYRTLLNAFNNLAVIDLRVTKGEVYKGHGIVQYQNGDLLVSIFYGSRTSASFKGESVAEKESSAVSSAIESKEDAIEEDQTNVKEVEAIEDLSPEQQATMEEFRAKMERRLNGEQQSDESK